MNSKKARELRKIAEYYYSPSVEKKISFKSFYRKFKKQYLINNKKGE